MSKSVAVAAGAAPVLEVHEVGDFIASFVPTQGDFERLDDRFRLPTSTWDKVPQYRDWGFAVFQLKATSARTAKTIHPMAFDFPTRLGEALYFPTLHIHDGNVSKQADFDHTLYFQGEPFQEFAHDISPTKAVEFMKVGKAKGIVEPDTFCLKRSVIGRRANADVYARMGESN